MHQRAEIREELRVTLNPILNVSVFKQRSHNLNESELPAICIYSLEETTEKNTQTFIYKRNCKIRIEICIKSLSSSFDDDIDAISTSVESRVNAKFSCFEPNTANPLGKKWNVSQIGNAHFIEPQASMPFGSLVMDYEVIYYSDESAPLEIEQDFNEVSGTINNTNFPENNFIKEMSS